MSRIFIVDDDPRMREVVAEVLQRAGYETIEASSGVEMRRRLATEDADLIILDVKMPDEDGISILRELRRHSRVPVMFLSVLGHPPERATGLEEGADDYLAKPFDPRELTARARSILARTKSARGGRHVTGSNDVFQFAGYTLDVAQKALLGEDGREIPLTHSEREILRLFLERPYENLSRDTILRRTLSRPWSPNDRSLDVLISRLRHKIEPEEDRGRMIISVRGVGYCLSVDVLRNGELVSRGDSAREGARDGAKNAAKNSTKSAAKSSKESSKGGART